MQYAWLALLIVNVIILAACALHCIVWNDSHRNACSICCTIPSIQLVNHVDAGQWVKGFRTVRHAQQNTTGACEGFHSVLKLLQLSQRSRLGGRRLDWLLKVLTGGKFEV